MTNNNKKRQKSSPQMDPETYLLYLYWFLVVNWTARGQPGGDASLRHPPQQQGLLETFDVSEITHMRHESF